MAKKKLTERKKAKKNKIKQDRGVNFVINLLLIIFAVVALYPIWFVLIASVSDPTAIGAGEVYLFPKGFTLEAYKKMLEYEELFLGYRNSFLFMIAGTFLMLLGTLPAAYALSRPSLKGRRVINFLVVISMYFSGGLIPTYLLHRSIGWINTPWVLLIPGMFQAYYLILARSNFESMPEALHEAAMMDGCSEFRYLTYFAIPLSKATTAVLCLFNMLSWWNNYMGFFIYIDNPRLQSLQVYVRNITQQLTASLADSGATIDQFLEQQRVEMLLKYSVIVITAVPFCLLYPFVQKYFNKGVMIGSIKG